MSRAVASVLTAVGFGVAVGSCIAFGMWWPLAALVLWALLIMVVVRLLVPVPERLRVGAVVALAFAAHAALAAFLYTGSLTIGRGGFVTGDDADYAAFASGIVSYLHGHPVAPFTPPLWGGSDYLLGAWVYLETAIFFVTGTEPLVPIFLNGTFALLTALLVYDMARRLFDARAAIVALALVAFYPSLVLWSSLNLKDALVLVLIAVVLWSVVRFQERPRWWALALAFAALVPLESTRRYMFIGLALLIPLAVVITPRLPRAARVRWSALAIVASVAFLLVDGSGSAVGRDVLATLENERESMAIGARTAFVEPPPLSVKEGDAFVVSNGAPLGDGVSRSSGAPTVVYVAPSNKIVVTTPAPTLALAAVVSVVAPPTVAPTVAPMAAAMASTTVAPPSASSAATIQSAAASATTSVPTAAAVAQTPAPAPTVAPGAVAVRPGDIVVIGTQPPGPPPALSNVQALDLGSRSGEIAISTVPSGADRLLRTLTHIPMGITYAAFAPFPWQIRRGADAVVGVEMLLWYVVLASATAVLLRAGERRRVLIPLVLVGCGIALLLALAEGNVGTLYRHRAMLIPWTIVLSAPALADAGAAALRRLQRRRDPIMAQVNA